MKKLLLLLFIVPLLAACSKDDNNEPEPEQDYTSFTLKNNTTVNLRNVVIGYKVDDKYIKVAELGDLKFGETSAEVKVDNEEVVDLYVFADYVGTIVYDIKFLLKSKRLNNFILPSGLKVYGADDKSDPTQYPQ